ncbi:MAG: hypothetical protein QG575_467, partial [Euryarchaeota archaeon]|nr:hypothetical protein [Euryarchaeota archaeon]
LIMPALSMPNNEMRQDQKQCDCPNSLKDRAQMGHGQDNNEKSFDCQKSMMGEDGKQMGQGQDGKEKSFGCQKSMMGEDGKHMGQGHKPIKSMMGDKGREDKTEVKIVIINVNT